MVISRISKNISELVVLAAIGLLTFFKSSKLITKLTFLMAVGSMALLTACGGGSGGGNSSFILTNFFDQAGGTTTSVSGETVSVTPVLFNDIRNVPSVFTINSLAFDATFSGTLLHRRVRPLYVAGSNNSWGVDGQGTATISFSEPVDFVNLQARGTDSGVSLPDANVTLRFLDSSGEVISESSVPNDNFATFSATGDIQFIQITNTVDSALAIIGQISAQLGSTATNFSGTQNDVVFNDIRNVPSAFTVGNNLQLSFEGSVVHRMMRPLYVSPSTNAWGADELGLATVRFSEPAQFATIQARAIPGSTGTMNVIGASGEVILQAELNPNQFETFNVGGSIAGIELENTGGDAVIIGEISVIP